MCLSTPRATIHTLITRKHTKMTRINFSSFSFYENFRFQSRLTRNLRDFDSMKFATRLSNDIRLIQSVYGTISASFYEQKFSSLEEFFSLKCCDPFFHHFAFYSVALQNARHDKFTIWTQAIQTDGVSPWKLMCWRFSGCEAAENLNLTKVLLLRICLFWMSVLDIQDYLKEFMLSKALVGRHSWLQSRLLSAQICFPFNFLIYW